MIFSWRTETCFTMKHEKPNKTITPDALTAAFWEGSSQGVSGTPAH